MLIEEIIRSCVHEDVAAAAVACIGQTFSTEVAQVAQNYGMSVGAFAALAVACFARRGDEGELRAVQAATTATQEPILAGLHRILSFALAASVGPARRHAREPLPPFPMHRFEPSIIAACPRGAS